MFRKSTHDEWLLPGDLITERERREHEATSITAFVDHETDEAGDVFAHNEIRFTMSTTITRHDFETRVTRP